MIQTLCDCESVVSYGIVEHLYNFIMIKLTLCCFYSLYTELSVSGSFAR